MTIVAMMVGIPVSAAGPTASEDWTSTDIGSVGVEGGAVKTAGVWAISGAGADIWGTEDSFQFLHTLAYLSDGKVVVRVNDVADTDEFAKAGLMLRGTLATDAAAVIVDVKPSHEVEFMHRPTAGAEMRYDAGTVVSLPAWLKLDWAFTSSSGAGISYSVTASTSQDGTTWTAIGQPVAITHPCCSTMEAGAIVTSHNPDVLNTAHFEGLSMLSRVRTSSDIGGPALRGSAVEHPAINGPLAVEGAGADIWGDADSFHFVHTSIASNFQFEWNIESLDNTDPFAKAGLMIRDSLAPDAMSVILDVKPNSEVEFMARRCTGCNTDYLAGTTVTLPAEFILIRNGSTFEAYVAPKSDFVHRRLVGSVDIPMRDRVDYGVAVTSHNPGQLARAVFSGTAR